MQPSMKANWEKWESTVAEDFGGRIQTGSGNQWFAKGDVKTGKHVISCKQTDRDSFSITGNDWNEIRKIAEAAGRSPILAINMNGKRIAVMDYDEMLYILGMIGEVPTGG